MTSTILEAVLNEHEDETLDHYGVKAMRWGRRKKRETSGSSGPKANRKPPTQEERRKNIKRRDTILAAGSGVASSIINDVRANRKIDSRLPRGYDKGRIGRMAFNAIVAGGVSAQYTRSVGAGMRNIEATVSKKGDRRVMSVMNSAGAIASGLVIDSAFNGGYRAKKTRHITGNADRIREKVDFDSWTKELKK